MTERRDRAYLTEEELDQGATLTDTEVYEGELPTAAEPSLESLTETELRAGETGNPDVAAEEGLTWVAPMDPPVIPADNPDGIEIAAGFGTDSMAEPYDADHEGELLSVEGDMEERIREALRADAATSDYADSLVLGNRGGEVVVRGTVAEIDDTDNVVAVISNVTGVTDVTEELEVQALAD